ncbi:Uncharacterised protein [Serratia fonticola]|uniref:GTPase n=1 Tax=Serratia fonticola TaxID=47917 RepID=UPI00217B2E1C|nr:GTPase [Serratia fonticola]CAI0699156.1 Uncharacterised protein [Serratia fonticola]
MAIEYIPLGVKTLSSVYSNKKFLSEMIAKVIYWSLDTDIVVTGYPGSGKSFFFESLKKERAGKKAKRPEVSVREENEILCLSDDFFPSKITIIPGQLMSESNKSIVKNIIENKKLKGIIHLLDWGHSHHRHESVRAVISSKGIRTIEELREYNLEIEISYLKFICKLLEKRGGKIDWFVFVLNKVDLYDRGDAISYYDKHPEFIQLIERIKKITISQENIKFIPICSDRCDFEFNGGKIPSSKVRSDEEKLDLLINFHSEIKLLF